MAGSPLAVAENTSNEAVKFPVSKSQGRRKRIPPAPRRHSWFDRLAPEVRVIGLVVILMGIAAAIVLWPRQEKEPPQPLTVVVPADEPLRLAFQEARRSFMASHKDIEVVLIEAQEQKMPAYEAMWRGVASGSQAASRAAGKPERKRGSGRTAKPVRKSAPGVDLLIGAEAYLARWAQEGLLESWDDFLETRDIRLSSASLEAGQVAGEQRMLPLALELASIEVSAPGHVAQPDSLQALASLAARLSVPGKPALAADWRGEWAEAVLLATAYAGGAQGQNARMLIGRAGDALGWWRRGVAEGWASKPGVGESRPPLVWAGQRAWFEGRGQGIRLLLPPGADAKGTICVVYGALLPSKSKRKDAAQAFAGELLSQKFQLALAQRAGLLPAAVKVWPKLEGAEWKALATVAARSLPLPAEWRARESAQRFARAAKACLNGEISPAAAAAEMTRSPNRWDERGLAERFQESER